MRHERTTYQIRIEGQLDGNWSVWLGGLAMTYGEPGETVLTGLVEDQAALHGILTRLRDLGLTIVSVNRVDPDHPT
jgi:hypothetical protein